MSTQTAIILNDVESLSQWDSGRTVSVIDNIPIVHFSNDSSSSIPVAVKNGVAEIPNILLQDHVPITAWAFVITENGGYTQHHVQFDVCAKPRPLDYIYTETEVANAGLILKYIGELDSLATSDKTSLVAAINEISAKKGDYLTRQDIVDEAVEGSTDAISSGAVYALLGNAQQTISEITNILGAT